MTLVEQIIVLQVVLPLLCALFCSLTSRTLYSLLIVSFVGIFGIISNFFLVHSLYNDGGISYHLGNWPSLYGIELYIGAPGALILLVLCIVLLSVSFYGFYSFKIEQVNSPGLFCAALLLCYSGMVGIVVTNDIFNLYVFLEVSSLAAYTIVAAKSSESAFIAAFEYLIIGTVASTFYLIGIGFLYSATGTLNMSVLSTQILDVLTNRVVQVGIVFVLVGLLIKSALFPMHLWLTKAYTSSYSFTTAFLSGTSTKIAIYALIKFIYVIFGTDVVFQSLHFSHFLTSFSILAILFGAVCATLQTSPLTILAYSSVSQIGYIVLAACTNSKIAVIAVFLQIVSHSFAKVSMFMISGYSENNTNHNISSKILPYMIINSFSLLGMPLTAGFLGKFYLFDTTLKSGNYVEFCILALSSVLTAIYLWKLYIILTNRLKDNLKFPKILHVPLTILAVLNFTVCIFGQSIVDFLVKAPLL